MYHNYHTKESGFNQNNLKNGFRMMGLESLGGNQHNRANTIGAFSPTISSPCFKSPIAPTAAISPVLNYRSYSSFFGGKGDRHRDPEVAAASGGGESAVSESGGGSDIVEMVKTAWQSVEGGSTLTATVLAWAVLPRILRRLHKYSTQGPVALLSRANLWGPVLYEKSFWGALEDPLRYLITFMAFSQIGTMVAPTTITSQYIAPAWRGAVIISFVWFLHRWSFLSSGLMALAEACGVAVQSILTVGGIGGVATAFAARDVLGNVLSGLSVQISQPFSIGDTIKAGSVEGQVVEMGLTTTSLLSAEKFPIIVPNSLFSSQVIVNKSRAQWRAMVTKIPLQVDDLSKIPQISEDIKSMLRLNSKVYLEKEPPYCFLSRIERSYAELTLGCNLKHMSKDELFSTQQDILLQAVQIIKQHGSKVGSTLEYVTSQ
ncbi:mechanosensitive ion channel protein [Actinidia rufa]|uniref:Mechanosensitive ion channel protein n=1 Tax=Actinidia rufa TaxID=165716 RepID=A0A7J0H1J4_9ERIC|nr:mechanosensitive ion channel protein [Actinidia rufa]